MISIPLDVFEAAVRVAGDALYWKSSLRHIFRTSGVSENAATRYEQLSKYQAMRTAWDELERVGSRGRIVQKNIVQALANLEKPDPKADQQVGMRAIEELRRLAKRTQLLVDPEELKRQQRKDSRDAAAETRAFRTQRLANLRSQFQTLHGETNTQSRGYAFEKLLAELFRTYEFDFTGSYKTDIDQVDGALVLDGFTYLMEARWRQHPAVEVDLAGLSNKASRRIHATRAIFISMAGFRPEVVAQYRLAHESRLILLDGEDLALIFEGRVELPDALRAKTHAASVDGEPHLRLATI